LLLRWAHNVRHKPECKREQSCEEKPK
jgi:hypothetical protein